MADSRTIPPPDFDDDDPAGQAAWEIATAETLRARGDLADAASWYRRAANHLMEAGDDERAIEIAKLAAELVALESAVRPPSQREPRVGAGMSSMPTSAPSAIASSAPATIASAPAPAAVPVPVPAPARPAEPPRPKAIEPAPGSAAARLFGTRPTGATASPASPVKSAAPPKPLSQSVSATSSASPSISAPALPKSSVAAPSVPRPASVVPAPAGAKVPTGTFTVPKPVTAAATSNESKVTGSVRAPQPSLRPSAYAAPATPAARTAEINALAKAPIAPHADAPRAPNPFAAEDDSTSVIALGAIASPIASLLDEAVANLEPTEASGTTPVTKRPLSFLPQRAAESESIAARLSALPLFSELPPDQLRQLSRQLITESRNADEHVCESGAPEGPLYVLLSGSAWVGVAGRSSPLAVLTAGDIVGEIAALYGGPRTATVVAREPMELVGVAPSALRSMARDFPAFRESLIESVRDRMRESLPHIATSLRRLSDEARKAVLDACEFVELAEGNEMLVEGEPAPALYLIAAGEAECYGGELGVSRAVRARVGEIVGAGSVLTSAPSGVSARAARTLLAARVSREKMRELIKRVPSLNELLDDVAAPGRGVVC